MGEVSRHFRGFFKSIWAWAGLTFVLVLPLVFCKTVPATDASNFYCPMINAISTGDWTHGFWPGIQPLFPLIGGFFAWTFNLEAFTAAKLVSALFFALTIIPLYKLQRLIFNEKVAWLSLVLFVCCTRLFRYAGSGIQDTGKIFFLIWVVYEVILFVRKASWHNVWRLGLATTGLTLIRPEGSCLGPMCLIALVIWRFFKGERKFLPVKSFCTGLFCLLLISPWMIYQFKTSGYPVLHQTQIGFVKPVLSKLGYEPSLISSLPDEPEAIVKVKNRPCKSAPTKFLGDEGFYEAVVKEVFKGFLPLYMLFYVPVLFLRVRRREFCAVECFLLVVAVTHTLFFLLATKGLWTQKRYIVAVLPLFFGWAAVGLDFVLSRIREKLPKKGFVGLVSLVLLGCYLGGLKDLRPSKSKRKRNELSVQTQAVEWFRKYGGHFLSDTEKPLQTTNQAYYNGSRLKICSEDNKLIYMAGGAKVVPSFYNRELTYEEILTIFNAKRVNFVVVDKRILESYPALQAITFDSKNFQLIKRFEAGNQKEIVYAFKSHVKLNRPCFE